MKLTVKQERFCQRYVELGNASEAYRQSYDAKGSKPNTVNRKAYELLENGNIAARIELIKERHAKRHDVTIDSLTKELEEARSLAHKIEQPAAAVSATLGKAKIHGHLIDQQKHSGEIAYIVRWKK